MQLNITISIGVSVLLPTAEKRDAVLMSASADKSRCKAKEIGRNCVVFLGKFMETIRPNDCRLKPNVLRMFRLNELMEGLVGKIFLDAAEKIEVDLPV